MIVGKRTGFTIVELLVVVVVLLILTAMTSIIYSNVQVQARDARNADAADKFADAVKLFTAEKGHFPRGGSGSTVAIGAGTECTDGKDGWASFGYTCDIEDTLAASGYIKSGFTFAMAPNTLYPTDTNGARALMVYYYVDSSTPPLTKAMVMYSMEDPSASDTAHFNAELTKCYGSVPGSYGPRDTYGMKNGICVVAQTVN